MPKSEEADLLRDGFYTGSSNCQKKHCRICRDEGPAKGTLDIQLAAKNLGRGKMTLRSQVTRVGKDTETKVPQVVPRGILKTIEARGN